MSGTRARCATIVVSTVSSLLLIFAASCSFEKDSAETTVGNQSSGDYYAQSGDPRSCLPTGRRGGVANPFCDVCHQDFDGEELALNHELAGIGCERCHGESPRHRSDEANITPPEIMYTKAKINPTCMMCHPRSEISAVDAHEPVLAGAETVFDRRSGDSTSAAAGNGARYCTDCHGKAHRMKVRTTLWNKATGELITR